MASGLQAHAEFELLRLTLARQESNIEWLCDEHPVPDRWSDSRGFSIAMTRKADLLKEAIQQQGFGIWMDADTVVLARLGLDTSCPVILSPHYASPHVENMYGKYNAGLLATRSLGLLDVWKELTLRHMWFTDQKPLEIAVQGRSVVCLGPEYNIGHWRRPYFALKGGRIRANGQPLVTYHGHVGGLDPYDRRFFSLLKNYWKVAYDEDLPCGELI